jgi:hypothetical protein
MQNGKDLPLPLVKFGCVDEPQASTAAPQMSSYVHGQFAIL